MDTEKENKKWEKILTGCSTNSARIILILECLLCAVSSKLFFFLFILLISMGTATYRYVNKSAPFSVFIFATIASFFIYLLFDKVLYKNWDNEQIETKHGIKEIKNYINKIK